MKKLFFDAEFCDINSFEICFLSIGMVKETGEELYLEIEQPIEKCGDWVVENILSTLTEKKITEEKAVEEILDFIDDECQVVADVNQFDWIGLVRLFGGPFEIPFHYIPLDLATKLEVKGYDPDIDREKLLKELGINIPAYKKHYALSDAQACKAIWEKL